MDIHPIFWLVLRNRKSSFGGYATIVGLLLVFIIATAIWGEKFEKGFGNYEWALDIYCGLWIAMHSNRIFLEGRKSGTLELLLCSRLNEQEIVQFQFRGLVNFLLFPMILMLFLEVFSSLVLATSRDVIQQLSPPPTLTDLTINFIAYTLINLVSIIATIVALIWFGMWSGLISKKPSGAAFRTLLWVGVIPIVICILVFSTLFFKFNLIKISSWDDLTSSILITPFYLTMMWAIIRWSRRRLFSRLRLVASGIDGKKALE